MRARKFLAAGGRGPFSGVTWPPCADGSPGEWIDVDGVLAPCARGIHVCRDIDLAYWIHDELWDVEVEGPAVEGVDCLVVARARLLRRIDAWTEGRHRFARASIEHAAASLGSAAGDALGDLLDDAQIMATHGYPALASYTAAVAVGRASGGDAVQGFRTERAWQSVWIADFVGRAS
jgi:hypothetical protein